MEQVLDVYKRPHDPRYPVVCMDESPRQLIRETRLPLAVGPSVAARHDYEYQRCGVCTVFMAVEPLAGQRTVRITERRTKQDWARFLQDIDGQYRRAEKITLVMDNLNTHGPGSLYATLAPQVRHDYEYQRCGVCTVFMAVEPLAGQRTVRITERRTKQDWARFLQDIDGQYRRAEKITLVMDNLNTHGPGSLYATLAPPAAKALWDRFEFVYTPKHGSWLNMAEIELNVLIKQCLDRRIDNLDEVQDEVAAWQNRRNNAQSRIDWQFTSPNARIKLKRLYPTLDS